MDEARDPRAEEELAASPVRKGMRHAGGARGSSLDLKIKRGFCHCLG